MTRETNVRFVRYGLLGIVAFSILQTLMILWGSNGANIDEIFVSIGSLVFFGSIISIFFFGLFPRLVVSIIGPKGLNWREGEKPYRAMGMWIEDSAEANDADIGGR